MQPTQFLKVELHQNLFFTPKIVGLKIPQICVPDDLTIRIFPFVRGFDGIMGFLFLGVALIGYPRFLTSNHSSLPIGSTYGIFIILFTVTININHTWILCVADPRGVFGRSFSTVDLVKAWAPCCHWHSWRIALPRNRVFAKSYPIVTCQN